MNAHIPLVLLIDDNPGDVDLTKIAFEELSLDARFAVAMDGAAGIDVLQAVVQGEAERPDLVLLDLNLPRANGHEVLAFARSQPLLVDLPVVVLTTSTSPRDRELALQGGAAEYLVKPSRLAEFIAMIDRLRPRLQSARHDS